MNTPPAIYEQTHCITLVQVKITHTGGVSVFIDRVPLFILCSYFVFDPSVKFRFKTQGVFIDCIDCILFPRKMKKSGE